MQEKGSFALSDIQDIRASPRDPRCFQFALKSTGKVKVLRAEDEESAQHWRTAIEEAIHDLNKPSREDEKAREPQTRRRDAAPRSVTGDYRNKQKYWPRVLDICAGEFKDGLLPGPVKSDIAWGEVGACCQSGSCLIVSASVRRPCAWVPSRSCATQTSPRSSTSRATARSSLTRNRSSAPWFRVCLCVLRQCWVASEWFWRADYEDLFPVSSTNPEDQGRHFVVRLRLQSVLRPHARFVPICLLL